ncbi:MAG: TonB-dependent receptor [Melioribacteraceae bacterium]|nr:TonB-dependent receptor [Melioribacteraceae bacterium]
MLKSVFISFVLLINNSLFAQSDTIKTTLQEVVISATRTETPYYTLASSVSIISADDIAKKQYYSVVDLLREIPGVTIIQQGGPGKLSNLFLRGANPNHTLVIIDGTEMNDPSSPNNAFDFSFLATHDIERIEIVKGPQSTLYGSEALAGVINIFTKRGSVNRNYNIQTEGGSNNFFRANINTSGRLGLIDYFLSINRIGSDGVSASNSKFGNIEKDGFTNNGLTAGFGFDLADLGNLNLKYRITKAESDLDQSEKFGDDPNYIYRVEEQTLSATFNNSSFNGKWENRFNTSILRRFSNAFDNFDYIRPNVYSDSYNRSSRIKFEWQNNLRFIDYNLITIGIETEREKANTSYLSVSEWGPYNSIFPEESVVTTGFYIQDQVNISNTFFTSIGFRVDKHQKFGSIATFRFAPAYYFSNLDLKFKFTYGTGFKAPSLFYLYDPMFGNPVLKPEKSKGWDIGFEKYLSGKRILIGLTYFNLKMENMFGFDSNFRTVNIAQASSKGIEFYTSLINIDRFSVNANYTFTDTKDLFDGSVDFNQQLLRRPKHQASINMNYMISENLNLNSGLRYVGKREDKDFSAFPAQRVVLTEYILVNISASYKLFNYLQLTGRVENLFDEEYEEVLYYGTLGRSFYLGLNISL